MTSEWAAAARLVRRTGFGATGADVDAVVREGAQRHVVRLMGTDPEGDPGAKRTPAPAFDSVRRPGKDADDAARKARRKARRSQGEQLTAWWLRRMAAVEQPFGEKAAFVWHAHFATSLKKVKVAQLMLRQNATLRSNATGDFGDLAYAMLTDAAMLRWLDGEKNTVKGPNENLSREFMEVFTLGHADGYTEKDVREGARALTGWKVDPRDGTVAVRDRLRDTGQKTFLGHSGDLGTKDFCSAVLAVPGCPRYLVSRLWGRFVSGTAPSREVMDRLVGAYGPGRDLGALFAAMFTDPAFAAAEATFVIGPVEWLIGAVRALHVPLDEDKTVQMLAGTLDSLGQLPFFPPSVGGWPSGPVWLSTAAADLRFRAARQLADAADLSALHGSATARLDSLAHLLGIDTWSARTLAVLKGSGTDPKQLVAIALNTPEYLVH